MLKDASLWRNPLYNVRLEKPGWFEPKSMPKMVFGYAISSKLRAMLVEADDQDINAVLLEALAFGMPVEANILERMSDQPAVELHGALIEIDADMRLTNDEIPAMLVVGIAVHDNTSDPAMTHFFALLHKDEVAAYVAERDPQGMRH